MTALALGAAVLGVAAAGAAAQAADDSTTQPAPSLEQLSLETERLYHRVRVDIIRVKLPTPDWLRSINEQRALLQKWGTQLTPQVRQLFLQQQQQLAALMRGESGLAEPATAPALPTDTSATSMPSEPGARAVPHTPMQGRLVLIAAGLIIDSSGHAVVPVFVDPDSLGGQPLRVITGDGRLTTATLVGSDRPSNLSVLQLNLHDVQPAALADTRPVEGSLVMTLTADGAVHLAIWNAAAPDPGLIVLPNGSVAGFASDGRFLAASACRPILGQILATGSVRRAQLGVRVREVSLDELLRHRAAADEPPWPRDVGRSAMLIDAVEPNSAAARAGLQRGDLILATGGQPVEDTATFAALIATQRGNTPLTILRNQQIQTITVDLAPAR